MASDKVVVLSAAAFEDFLKAAPKPVLVDFWATWCGPCKSFAPVFAQVADEVDGLIFAKFDVDESREIAIKYGIRAIPTLKLFKKGAVVETIPAIFDKADFKAKALSLV